MSLIGAVILLAIVNLIRRGHRALARSEILHHAKAARVSIRAAFFVHCSSKVIATLTCNFCSPGSIFVEANSARAIIGAGGGGA